MFVVTGGGRGIGRSLAQALSARRQSVLIVGRNLADLLETARFSPLIQLVCADVTTHEGRGLVQTALQAIPQLTGLIHNAGVLTPIVPITQMDEASWRHVMATNVDAPLFLSQLLHDQLKVGRVLHIGSGAAHFPVSGWVAYCVSKAALSMLTRCWQLECPEMAVASVMPGIVDTAMQAEIRESSHMEKGKLDFFKRLYSSHQLVSAETVAAFLCWLLLDCDKATYTSKEWDIYDPSHHASWLVPPFLVPSLEAR